MKTRNTMGKYTNWHVFMQCYNSMYNYLQLRFHQDAGKFGGDVKIQVLATARFCKLLQTLAIKGLQTLIQICQHLASSGRRAFFSRCSANDIIITLTAHKMGHVG